MSDPNTLGGLVRRRRLESGYSLGQLASKVGKTAAEVRAWERDAELPEHGILERLAETLELDLDEIQAMLAAQEAAAEEVEEEPEPPEVDEEPEPVAADAPEEVADEDEVAAVREPAEDAEETAAVAAETEEPTEDDLPGFPVEDPFTPPGPDDADEPVGDSDDESVRELIDAPTEAVPMPVITDTAAAARAQRAAVVLEEPRLPVVEAAPDADPGLLRYLEPLRVLYDPQNRYLYWMRSVLTIIVMLILLVVLFRLLGNLLDAVGELLDTIEPATTPVDDLDALGVGSN